MFVHGIRILLFVRVGVYDLSMVPRLRRGRLAGRALATLYFLRGHKCFQKSLSLNVKQEEKSPAAANGLENVRYFLGYHHISALIPITTHV